jgi:tetrahydromethanopterin S-methyltransferase subunit G
MAPGDTAKFKLLSDNFQNEINGLEEDISSVRSDVKLLTDDIHDISKTLDKIDNKLDFILPDLKSKIDKQIQELALVKETIAQDKQKDIESAFKIKLIWSGLGFIIAGAVTFIIKSFLGDK